MTRMLMACALGALAVAAGSGGAHAEGCLDQTRRMAGKYHLSIDPPDARPGQAPRTSDLATSGGVIEPPPTRDPSVIAPPTGQQSQMPTLPDVKPAPPGGASKPTTEKAADTVALQAVLTAARDFALKGDEEGCRDRLAKAEDLAGSLGGKGAGG